MTYAFNGSAYNATAWNGVAVTDHPAPEIFVLYNTTSITLDWSGDSSSVSHQLQVSLYEDFRTTFVDTTVSVSNYTFTDNQVDDAKRYWRVREYNGSIYTSPWSEVGHYWLDTSATDQIELDYEQWSLVDANETTDRYNFDMFPLYSVIPGNIYRGRTRNRLGELLSEYLTTKSTIKLLLQGNQYLSHEQLSEFRRYHVEVKTFYLCNYINGAWHKPMPHIWKVQFIDDPLMSMFTAGRPDLLTGTLNLQEV